MKTKTLFLVEDDIQVADMLKMYAENIGYRLIHAQDLEAVRRLLSEEFSSEDSIDACLVDLMFPGKPEGSNLDINGNKAVIIIKEYAVSKGYKEPRIAIATGRSDLAIDLGRELGVEVIAKPYRTSQITEFMEREQRKDFKQIGHAPTYSGSQI